VQSNDHSELDKVKASIRARTEPAQELRAKRWSRKTRRNARAV